MNTYKNGTMPLQESIETKLGSEQSVNDWREWYHSLKTGNIVNRNYQPNQNKPVKTIQPV